VSPLPSISAVLPAYNEVAVIADVARRTEQALRAMGIVDLEVLVVDDGSSDGTGDAVRALGEAHPEITVVRHSHNRGYGAALRSGFEAARCDAVFVMDSDAQFDPADIHLLLPHYRADTMVAGYRSPRNDSLLRRANHTAFFTVVRALFGPSLRDVNCAFKLFPRRLGVGLRSSGAMISTELALRARHLGYLIVEVPVPHYARTAGTPTGANPRVVARAFGELWQLRRDPVTLRDKAAAPDPDLGAERGR
jgi:glycosyltransferase involved in cell wall biosynthesis